MALVDIFEKIIASVHCTVELVDTLSGKWKKLVWNVFCQIPVLGLYNRHINIYIIALWGRFCRDVLPMTCCEHGHPSIATVHFSKFTIATNILFK